MFLAGAKLTLDDATNLAADGASPFAGSSNGLGAVLAGLNPRIIRTHCANHVVALSVGDAFKNSGEQLGPNPADDKKERARPATYISKIFKTLVETIAWHLNASAVRLDLLREIQKLHGDKKERAVVEAAPTRWHTWYVLMSNWIDKGHIVPIMQFYADTAAGDATAKGVFTKMRKFNFLATCALMCDALLPFERMHNTFEKTDLDFSTIAPTVQVYGVFDVSIACPSTALMMRSSVLSHRPRPMCLTVSRRRAAQCSTV